ncbi:hypothetical protein SAMN04488535_0088 [Corynebacterium mycetoides]|uniref:YCII-related domain-containing protein n=1 Tax=Corynebacterium mycetoides TaxID=38302 RepID=A0A1G9LBC7_9CORY|nr:hypothetical protein [Corynebacterium mycetoides]SDL59136.1 hypothetical protein SAMN04488535_0088 [Corynebacterium mycetoides]
METYSVDYDWAWGTKRPGDPVTLRAHFTFSDAATARRAVASFFDALPERGGVHGSGGWSAHEVTGSATPTTRVIDFMAGGEDVADAIAYATEDAAAHFSRFDATVRWEQLPH